MKQYLSTIETVTATAPQEQQEENKKHFYLFDGIISRSCNVTIKIIEDKLKEASYDEWLALRCSEKAIETIWNTPELNEPNPYGFIWFVGNKYDFPILVKREINKRIYKIHLSKVHQVKFCVYKRELESLEKLEEWAKNSKWTIFPLVVQARELWHSEIIDFQPLESNAPFAVPGPMLTKLIAERQERILQQEGML